MNALSGSMNHAASIKADTSGTNIAMTILLVPCVFNALIPRQSMDLYESPSNQLCRRF